MSPMHDISAPHIDGAHHRREAAKPKEMKPLLTREPLPHDREKKPVAQPQKKRKRVIPTKPAFSYDPKCRGIPSGRQDPPVVPPAFSGPSASESSTSSYDEQQTTPFVDYRGYDQLYDGHDAQKRPRIFSGCSSTDHPTSPYPDTPCTDVNEMSSAPPDFHDSPVSYTSSSSPDPSDQSPCAAEFTVQAVDYARQVQPPPLPTHPYGSQVYVQQPMVHQDSYGYPMHPRPDRPVQGYPVYVDAAYSRAAPHGMSAYPENNSYPYPPQRY